ncbi:MAG: serine/threonine-protein kinase [Myxococcota bacterium]
MNHPGDDGTRRLTPREREGLAELQSRLFGRPRPAMHLDRYLLLSRIGAGGAGVVYHAFDPSLDRKVAVKLLHGGGLGEGSKSGSEEILREAKAIAQLSHPNVVAIHDVGTYDWGEEPSAEPTDPRAGSDALRRGVYLVMELVDGQRLSEWIETPRSWRAVVEVFLQAGRGLVAAHARQLVHRDFKPGNVMVGADGRVRVLDFGLARRSHSKGAPSPATAGRKTDFDQTTSVAGTPSYMAPEQYRGEPVDARADQFSFCVALYQCLHGTVPFRGENIGQMQAAKEAGRFATPTKDSAVPRSIGRALRRGLAADPAERFPSMEALLRALAVPTRRRWALALTAVLTGASVAGLLSGRESGASAVEQACELGSFEAHLDDAWGSQTRERVQQGVERGPLGASTWALVKQGLDARAQRWTEQRAEACRMKVEQAQGSPVANRRIECLELARRETEALTEVLAEADDAAVARAVRSVSALTPLSSCEDDESLASALPVPAHERDQVTEVQRVRLRAQALQQAGRLAEAGAKAREAVDAASSLDHASTRAHARLTLARVSGARDDHAEAQRAYEQAWVEAERTGDSALAVEAVLGLVTTTGLHLARTERAEHLGRLARAKISGFGERPLLGARLSFATAQLRQAASRYPESAADYREALAVFDAQLGPQSLPSADCHNGLGVVALLSGRAHDARGHFEQARTILEAKLGPGHPDVGRVQSNLGNQAFEVGAFDEAVAFYEDALAGFEQTLGPRAYQVGATRGNLANVYLASGQLERALRAHEQSLPIYRETVGETHPDYARALGNVGAALDMLGRHEEALEQHLRVLELRKSTLDPSHGDFAPSYSNLGFSLLELSRDDEAYPWFERALEVWERVHGPRHPAMVETLWGLAVIETQRGEHDQAVARLRRAIELVEAVSGNRRELARLRVALARALWPRDPVQARALAERGAADLGTPRLRRHHADAVAQWLEDHVVPS